MRTFYPLLLFLLAMACSRADEKQETKTTDSISAAIPVDSITTDSLPAPLLPAQDSVYAFRGGSRFLYGFKNREGKIIVEPRFELAGDFSNGLAPVVFNNQHGFCDTSGQLVVHLPPGLLFDIRSNEMSGEKFFGSLGERRIGVVNAQNLYGYVSDLGEAIIPCQFETVDLFSEGMAAVTKNQLAGFIGPDGTVLIPYQYENVVRFSCGRACVSVHGKKGFINHQGKLVIPAIYNEAWFFSEGLCNVSLSDQYNGYFYIDTTGKTVIKGPFDESSFFEHGKAQVSRGERCWEIDRAGKKLRSLPYPCFGGC